MNNYNLITSLFKGIGLILIVVLVNVQNLWLASSLIQKIIEFVKA